MPLLCVPVQEGMPAPIIGDWATMSNIKQHRHPSLSSEEAPIPYYERKRSRAIRFPCKARGVPDNHTARNAYIDIPPEAGHGATVTCSHPVCVSSGRAFRYCSVCMIPVAKRNFAKRHAHGLMQAPQVQVKEEEVQNNSLSRSKRQRLGTIGSWDEALRLLQDDPLEEEKPTQVPKTIVIEAAPSIEELAEVSFDSELTAQEREWLKLFHQRPVTNKETDIRTWMGAILETAEISDNIKVEVRGAVKSKDEDFLMMDLHLDDYFLAD